jgi:hypothetical protein
MHHALLLASEPETLHCNALQACISTTRTTESVSAAASSIMLQSALPAQISTALLPPQQQQ